VHSGLKYFMLSKKETGKTSQLFVVYDGEDACLQFSRTLFGRMRTDWGIGAAMFNTNAANLIR